MKKIEEHKTESAILKEALQRMKNEKQGRSSVSGWDYNDGGTYGDGYGDATYGDASYGEGPAG